MRRALFGLLLLSACTAKTMDLGLGDAGPGALRDSGAELDAAPRDAAPDGGSLDASARDAGFLDATAQDAEVSFDCGLAAEHALMTGRWGMGAAFVVRPGQRMMLVDRCSGIEFDQFLTSIDIDENGRFRGPIFTDYQDEWQGCLRPLADGRLALDVHACEVECYGHDQVPGMLGTVSFAPTGAIRLQVEREGRVSYSPTADCLECGPIYPVDPACISDPMGDFFVWYEPEQG